MLRLCEFGWALYVTYASSQSSPPACWMADGDVLQGHLGEAVSSAGDVNGDGFDDVIAVGGGSDARLYLGASTGLSAVVWRAALSATSPGTASGAGDVNGDSYDDVIVGDSGFDWPDRVGRALVYLGSPAGLSAIPAWIADGGQPHSAFGASVSAAGDVNGDGYGDVIVGSSYFDGSALNVGRACVYLGSATGLAASPAWFAEGTQYAEGFGYRVSLAGDVNGDGYDDAIIAAPGYHDGEFSEGAAFLYLGSATGLAASPARIFESNQRYAGCIPSGAGDVNQDGYDDVILGQPAFADDYNAEGRALVHLGSLAGPATNPDWTVEGDGLTRGFGYAVSRAGDVNRDGFGDVLVVCSNDALDIGCFLYLGSTGGLLPRATWVTGSDQYQAPVGSAAVAGDVNGDGYDDVVVGFPTYTGAATAGGRILVYPGSPLGLGRSAVFSGDGVSRHVIVPRDANLGSYWSAPVQFAGYGSLTSGPISLVLRTQPVNGPTVISPISGNPIELLIHGPLLARISGSYSGQNGDILPQLVPNQSALVGAPWAAQYYTFHGDASQAAFGFIGACP